MNLDILFTIYSAWAVIHGLFTIYTEIPVILYEKQMEHQCLLDSLNEKFPDSMGCPKSLTSKTSHIMLIMYLIIFGNALNRINPFDNYLLLFWPGFLAFVSKDAKRYTLSIIASLAWEPRFHVNREPITLRLSLMKARLPVQNSIQNEVIVKVYGIIRCSLFS
jgi:hypothetical protein